MLKMYDSMSKGLRAIPENSVSMYVCGVTVYDHCHIGHARCYLVWDFLRRWMDHTGRQVQHVQNFTDIDDKIIARALREGVNPPHIAEKFIDSYFEDMDWLNVRRAHTYPRVSQYFRKMQRAALQLCGKGFASVRENDDIRFRGDAYRAAGGQYGRLSGQSDQAEDFVIWKSPKTEEIHWFPEGRPGWHLECSVMIEQEFKKDTIDIHCGGGDLIFPHHENEIAQSECLHNMHPLANHWMHNGFVVDGEEKMSKSLGNSITIRDYRKKGTDPNALRFWVAQAGYRKPLTKETLDSGMSHNQWMGLREKLRTAPEKGVTSGFAEALDDDLNTPVALAELLKNPTLEMANILGFKPLDETPPQAALELLAQRNEFRVKKQWDEADRTKKELMAMGWVPRDNAGGTVLVRA